MTDNSRIIKNSLILYIRLIVVSVISLITSRYVLQVLGVSDYGLYTIVGGIVIIMSYLNMVMTTTTYTYVALEIGRGDLGNVAKVFNISFVIHLALAILVIIFAFTLGVFYINNFLNVADG